MMNSIILVQLICAALLFKSYVDATKCKPYSTFKVDCDECQCSSDGTQYSCTVRICKNSPFANDNLQFDRLKNKPKIFERYLNDGVPPDSREEMHNEFEEEDLYEELNPEQNENGEGQFQDVSLSEQDASVLDSELPPDHRRYAKPLGLGLY